MQIDHMAQFIALAETPNFTVVAERLYLAQSSLTKHIQALESELGTPLLERTTHHVVVTEAGLLALESFKRILDEYEGLLEVLKQRQAGTTGALAIGALYYGLDQYLGPILAEMERRYPSISLDVMSQQPHQVIAGLKDGSLDAGFIFSTPALPDDAYVFQRLAWSEPYFIRARHPGAPAPLEQPVSAIADETLVIMSVDREYMDQVMEFLGSNGVAPKAIVDAGQVDLVPGKLRSTGGVFVGGPVLRQMAPDELDFTRITAPRQPQFALGIAARIGNPNPALGSFLAVCAELAEGRENEASPDEA